jgi:L-amino acid N-acyltransferase YncA
VLGFQWVSPHPNLPPESCDIASFVQIGRTGLGIGSALFTATAAAAKALGYKWINATIRADNDGGLTYYQSRGFRTWTVDEGVQLDSGQVVNKISKRYDL